MPPRLGYKKSRMGCLRCKQRRVKCDENRPCSACVRHGIECSLGLAPESSGSGDQPPEVSNEDVQPNQAIGYEIRPRSRVSSFRTVTSPSMDDLSGPTRSEASLVSTPDPFPYFSEFTTSQSPKPETDDTWITDLELMHQYTSSTYLTFPRGVELSDVWQFRVPKLALSYPFLLHQVLATAAFHLAFLNPEQSRRYFMNAAQHQNEAIIGLRTALSEISEDSCPALFATSSLLSICAFATYSDPTRASGHSSIDSFQGVLILIRGMSTILNSYEDVLKKGSLALLFRMSQPDTQSRLLDAIMDQLYQTTVSDDDNLTNADADICRRSISSTIVWIQQALSTSQEPEMRVAVSWPISLTEDFINLIRRRHPSALTVLAYHGVLLQFCGRKYWYMHGWGESIIQDIAQTLEPQRKDVIEWCRNAVENIQSF